MEQPLSADVEKLLQELLHGGLAYTRREAAEKLGRLTESNERITCTLMAAQESDSDPSVRGAAMQSLRAPVHQAVIEQNPDLVMKMAAQTKQQHVSEVRRGRAKKMTRYPKAAIAVVVSAVLFFFLARAYFANKYALDPGLPLQIVAASSALVTAKALDYTIVYLIVALIGGVWWASR